jgi:hypothetical protein
MVCFEELTVKWGALKMVSMKTKTGWRNNIWSSMHRCAGGEIEKNEMGGACGACGRGERHVQGYGGET